MDIRKFFSQKTQPQKKDNKSEEVNEKPKKLPKKGKQPKAKKTGTPSKREEKTPPKTSSSSQKVQAEDSSDDDVEIVRSRHQRNAKTNRTVIIDSDSEDDFKDVVIEIPPKRKGFSKKRKVAESSDEEFNPGSVVVIDDEEDEDFEPEDNFKEKTSPKISKSPVGSRKPSPVKKKTRTVSPKQQSESNGKSSSLQRIGSTSDHKTMKKRPREQILKEDEEAGTRSKYFSGTGYKAPAVSLKKEVKENPIPAASPKKRVLPPSMTAKGKVSPKEKSPPKRKTPPKKKAPTKPAQADDGQLPLTKKTFVITGVLDSLARDDAKDKIMALGGKVTGSVSGRTTYLVVGSVLEDGRPPTESRKHKDAVRRKIPILDEAALMAMLEEAEGKSAAAAPPPEVEMEEPKVMKELTKKQGQAVSGGGSSKVPHNEQFDLWADKYRPKKLTDVIGNADILRKLTDWLSNWNGRHLSGTLPKPKFSRENPGAKAALLSGPPGIGKTSTAMMLAKHLDYQAFELNASDARSKKCMEQQLVETVTNTALVGGGALNSKRVVIMDEVDGMAGNFDRGGIAELIKIIKVTKVPIICICNDRQSQKIRSLVNHCFDLRFRRPTPVQISKRMIAIAQMEGVQLEPNAAEMLASSVGNDIRQVMNALQMWAKTSKTIRYSDVKSRMDKIEKDKILRLSNFDCAKQILAPRSMVSLHDRYNAYFMDYSLIPLLVQQNYLDAIKFSQSGGDEVDRMSAAADSLGDGDLVNRVLRQDQNWGLLPSEALCYVRAGMVADGSIGFPSFPAWMGKFSQHNKRKRLLNELGTHLNSRVTGSNTEVRLSYLPHLRRAAFLPMLRKGSEGVPGTIEFLDEYGLSRDDMFELMPEFTLEEKDDPTKSMDSKTKSAFTRLYNSTSHKSQALVADMSISKSKKKKAAKQAETMILDGEEEEDASHSDGEEASDDDLEVFMKKKKGSKKSTGGAQNRKPGGGNKKSSGTKKGGGGKRGAKK